MKRLVVVSIVATLAACGRGVTAPDADLQYVRSLVTSERYDLALREAEDGLHRAERNGADADRWRFRVLVAEILIGKRREGEALSRLNGYGEPPAGMEWAEIRAQLLLLRVRACIAREPSKCADLLARATVAARNSGSQTLSAEAELRRGRLLLRQSRFEQARIAFRHVADVAARTGDTYQEASAALNIGDALADERRYDEAIPWLERAIALFTRVGAAESVARAHGNLGYCYFRLGDYENTLAHYEIAQDWFSRSGNRDSQQIWIGNAGNVQYEAGDYAAAEAAYKRALRIAREVPSPVWIGRWLNNLATTSIELGKWDAAEAFNNEALEIKRRSRDTGDEPTSLVNAARIEEGRGHIDRARELFNSALTMSADDPSVPLDCRTGLARLYIRQGRTREANVEFRDTVATIEERQATLLKDEYKLSYLGSLIRFYRQYVDFLVNNHQEGRALEVAESSRSRVLDERNGHGAIVEKYLAADYRQLARRTHSTLLEYWLGPGRSFLWVITPDRITLHILPSEAAIRTLVENYRAVIAGGRNPLEVADDTGERLYNVLVAPAVADAGGNGRFVIVPDEDLYSLNIESLPLAGDNHRFWIERATVAIAPSLNFLAAHRKAPGPRAKSGLLAIGDPSYASPQYPRLEYAEREIESIVSDLGGTNYTVLRGDAARPASYFGAHPGKFEFIHFAAHATASPRSPLDSAIILSGPEENRRLLARDVMTVPISAELVTISACRSAGGRTYAGEGQVGFAWAFLRAGAHNVIAGLWDVGDRSTAQLMSRLYRHMNEGKDVPESLRAAKLELIHEGGAYVKPFYWAPFQLYTSGVY